jgi:hypothetical protein
LLNSGGIALLHSGIFCDLHLAMHATLVKIYINLNGLQFQFGNPLKPELHDRLFDYQNVILETRRTKSQIHII